MNPSQKNNNPINLEYRGQPHATADGRFAQFDTPWHGWDAAHKDLEAKQKQGLTLRQAIFKFAPPVENNTNSYLENVAKWMNVDRDVPLSSLNVYALVGCMAQEEGYYVE